MEGLIPFVYRVIVEYKNNKQQDDLLGSWFNESPSAAYIRLPAGDSGRFNQAASASDFSVFRPEFGYSSPSPIPRPDSLVNKNVFPSSASQITATSSGVHSPVRRRVAA